MEGGIGMGKGIEQGRDGWREGRMEGWVGRLEQRVGSLPLCTRVLVGRARRLQHIPHASWASMSL